MPIRTQICEIRMMGKRISRVLVFAAAVLLVCSCAPNQRIVESNAELSGGQTNTNAAATPVVSSFEQDIESMRTADFQFIYVFRRTDRQPLDADDKRFASNAIPPEMNRRTVSDEGKAIIVGSNFRMPPENMKVLRERFAFEDFSRPDPGAMPSR